MVTTTGASGYHWYCWWLPLQISVVTSEAVVVTSVVVFKSFNTYLNEKQKFICIFAVHITTL
ncbi:hypothetical protein D0T85_18275 [Bacteroides sp. 519]|nr:hypothetical protein [Bacteroides sp. 519]